MALTNPYLPTEQTADSIAIQNHYGVLAYNSANKVSNFDLFSEAMLVKTNQYFQSKSYFEGSSKNFHSNGLIILLIFCMGVISFLRAFHRKRLDLIFKTLFNWKLGKQIIRYEKVYTHPVNIGLLLVFMLSTSLFFAYYFAIIKNQNVDFFSLGTLLFTAIFSFFLIKFLLYQFSAWLFDDQERVTEYVFHVALVNKFIGIILLILSVLFIYSTINSNWIFGLGLFSIGMALLVQIARGFRIGVQKSKDLILIILYLCTLEILPLLVVSKFIISKL